MPIGAAAIQVQHGTPTTLATATTDSAGNYLLVIPGAQIIDGRCYWGFSLSVTATGFFPYIAFPSGDLPIRCVPEPQVLDLQLTPSP